MNKFKKLVPAICMLLVSAVLMGTSTYAWFSMNTSVTATGLGVTATSNAQYLLIGTDNNATDKTATTGTGITVASTVSSANVYPVAYYATTTANTTIGTGTNNKLSQFTGYDASTWVGSNKWFTANNGSAASADDSVRNVKLITEGNVKYMATYTYYITLSADSEDFVGKLNVAMLTRAKINESTTNDDDLSAAVNAVVKVNAPVSKQTATTKVDSYIHLTTTALAGAGTNTTNDVYISKDTCITVTVYVYVDGNNAAIKSDNNGKAMSGKLSLSFDLGATTLQP